MKSDQDEAKAGELVIIRRYSGGEEAAHKGGVWKIAYADFMTAMMAFFLVMWLINATDKKTLTQVATYFNPMRLTDKVPVSRGLHQSETGAQATESTAASANKQPAQAKAAAGKAEAGKAKFTEEALYRDPQAALAQLAGEAREEQRRTQAARGSGEARSASGEAYRDPFEPAFRHEIAADKSPGTKRAQTPAPAPERGAAGEARTEGTGKSTAGAPAGASQQAREAAEGRAMQQAAERAAAAQLEAEIKRAVAQSLHGAIPHIDVTATDEGVLVSLTDDYDFGMFAIASAEPRPAMVVVMEKLGRVLTGRSEPLVVRGHTDGRPYKSGSYDNWRLSAARAHMAYHMLLRGGIDEKRFERIEGHADHNLRIPDDPEAAQNRRIEILLRKAKP